MKDLKDKEIKEEIEVEEIKEEIEVEGIKEEIEVKEEKKNEEIKLHEEEYDLKYLKEEKGIRLPHIIISLCVIFLLTFGIMKSYNYTNNLKKYAFSIENTKISRDIYDSIYKVIEEKLSNEKFENIEEKKAFLKDTTIYFIVDTYFLADYAEKNNISVTDEEIKLANDEFGVLEKEIALSDKVFQIKSNEMNKLTDKELEEYYNKNKSSYLKEGDIELIPIASNNPLDLTKPLDKSKFDIKKDTVSNLLKMGIYSTEIKENSFIELGYDNNLEQYKYFYIGEIKNEKIANFKDVKEEVKFNYDTEFGLIHLNTLLKENQEIKTIEIYEEPSEILNK